MQKFKFCEDFKGKSASAIFENQQSQKSKSKNKPSKKNKGLNEEANPVKMLQATAKNLVLLVYLQG